MSHVLQGDGTNWDDRAAWIVCTEDPRGKDHGGEWCYYGQRYTCSVCGSTFMPTLDIVVIENPLASIDE